MPVGYGALATALFAVFVINVLSLSSNPAFSGLYVAFNSGLPSCLAALACSALAVVFTILFKGALVRQATTMLNLFAFAFIIYFLMTIHGGPPVFQTLGIYGFLLIATYSLYYFANSAAHSYNQITLVAFAKAAALATFALIFRFAILTSTGSEVAGNIFLVAFLFAAAVALFYPFQFSSNSALRKTGKWLSSSTFLWLFLGLILAVYLLVWRGALLKANANATLIGEWIFVGVVVALVFLRLRIKLNAVSAPAILESWQKHRQDLGFKTTDEFSSLSTRIDAFLSKGKKNDLVMFLLDFLVAHGVHVVKINFILGDLINYTDPPTPRFVFSWDMQLYEEKKKQKRKQVMDSIVNKLSPDMFRNN